MLTCFCLSNKFNAKGIGANGNIRKNRLEHRLLTGATQITRQIRSGLEFCQGRKFIGCLIIDLYNTIIFILRRKLLFIVHLNFTTRLCRH